MLSDIKTLQAGLELNVSSIDNYLIKILERLFGKRKNTQPETDFSDFFTVKKRKKRKRGVYISIDKKNRKSKKLYRPTRKIFRKENSIELTSGHGTRILSKTADSWKCSFNFFSGYNICSHVIAVQELYENN